jgi:glutamyl-tRNA reductase
VAQVIIDQEADSWSRQQRSLAVVDTIRAFRDSVEKIRVEEVGKALQLLQRGQNAESVIETLTRNLTNKLMHKPTTRLKQASEEGRDDTINATQDLFGLDKKR